MPLSKTRLNFRFDNLQEAIDVDDSAGRSVPVNMNFIEEGFLTKDTGTALIGTPITARAHSLFFYKKKNGTSFLIRAYLTKLQAYDFVNRLWYDIPGCPTFTEGAEFGYRVYNDELWMGNAVDSYTKFDGTTFTQYGSAPKGNALEIFEDRMFISGVLAEPLTVYYSDVGQPQTFQVSSVVKPLGADSVVTQWNYYGTLLIFKAASIWKLTFEYDQVASSFIPKLQLQSGNYGAAGRKCVVPVENDLWFFTGREVRSVGFADNQIGVFGVNTSVISDAIKGTLATLDLTKVGVSICFYENRRFYLGIPLAGSTVDTVFVCHLLYDKAWTKYTGRDKARTSSLTVVDNVIYSTFEGETYSVVKWSVTAADAVPAVYYLLVEP